MGLFFLCIFIYVIFTYGQSILEFIFKSTMFIGKIGFYLLMFVIVVITIYAIIS